jgi:hypothetical protein
LKDANGKAVADGTQDIIFKLYTQESGGIAAWEEPQSINVFGGVYSTHLGKTVSLENLSWGTNTYFVGVTVQGTELTPRTELTFAPYSLGSPRADVANTVICSGAVGDIKYSILNPTQFATVNGNCWVPMDGKTIIGSKLATITNMITLPDGGGLFLRSQEFSGSFNHDPDRSSTTAIASMQEQAFKEHNHNHNITATGNTSTNGAHSHGYDRTSEYIDYNDDGSSHGNPNATENGTQTTVAGDHSHNLNITVNGGITNAGGTETRPKNLNFWIYIRIN